MGRGAITRGTTPVGRFRSLSKALTLFEGRPCEGGKKGGGSAMHGTETGTVADRGCGRPSAVRMSKKVKVGAQSVKSLEVLYGPGAVEPS